ncbi:hypothetical protein [Streptomyces sp. enrichment culture]|uniref:hypothetical protein n=1 Tax=Streptomyces sp. enrichment culture TaxID=1795815 RepID=UPI003F5471AE
MTLAYGALALILALSAGALLSRWLVTPAGRRAPGAYDIGWCPAERQEHLHRYNTDGTRTCCACGCTTPTAVPRG